MLNYDYMVDRKDTDKDGLTDYEEINKYLTDLNKSDSDGDGIQDGDWNERTEYAYTISARRELAAPFNSASLYDTFEDIKIISETRDKLVYDVVLYPYAKDIVTGNSNWKEYGSKPEFTELLRSRKTTNWDENMQKQIIASIPESCKTDLDVVKFLIPYYLSYKRANPMPMTGDPTDLFVDLRGIKPIIYNKQIWDKDKKNSNASDEDLIDQILFAKRMFNDRIDGACTASATYMTAVLRAAGIPARIIETNSLLHHGDYEQVKLLNNLKNTTIRKELLKQGDPYYGHYYIEAYVGSRWIKINNNGTIFESNYINGFPGVFLIKADTFFDYADTAMVDIFKNYFPQRPYKLVSLSDKYGKFYNGVMATADSASINDSKAGEAYLYTANGFDKIKNFNEVTGFYFYGDKNFCDNMKSATGGKRTLLNASINYFKKEAFDDNCVIVISANIPYSQLPQEIRNQITDTSYLNLKMNEYMLVNVSKAQVIIVNK